MMGCFSQVDRTCLCIEHAELSRGRVHNFFIIWLTQFSYLRQRGRSFSYLFCILRNLHIWDNFLTSSKVGRRPTHGDLAVLGGSLLFLIFLIARLLTLQNSLSFVHISYFHCLWYWALLLRSLFGWDSTSWIELDIVSDFAKIVFGFTDFLIKFLSLGRVHGAL